MSQNDFIIANQTAPNFRSDLNNALQAAVSNSSGASAPSTTYANMLWYDTTNDILKIRSEADDAWISIGYLDQSTNVFYPFIGSTQITAFLDEDDMVSDSATGIPSQQSVKAYVDSQGLGVGQTWQDVSGSRAQNTSYQNTTGKPIVVHIWGGGSSTTGLQVSTDNSTWVNVGRGEANYDSITVIVPDQHYYRMTAGYTTSSWMELR